jgi:hypothetical protein
MKTKGCRSYVLASGKERIVHVIAKVLGQRMASGDHSAPMIGVRPMAKPEKVSVYRHVEILGKSKLLDTPEHPLPGTDGRGICYLVTKAPIRVYADARR